MRILVTNDDGINAPGLKTLIAIAQDVAGPGGEVWVVAPAFEQSGVAHCISYTHPMMVSKLAERRYATEGSPADCVLVGIYDVLEGQKPDLILSGVNRGNNSGENTMYSGTLGAAMEGALQGVKSIGLSQFLGPETKDLDDEFEVARDFGVQVVRDLLEKGIWEEDQDYRIFYSVNFPPRASKDVKGVRIATQGFRKGTSYGIEPHFSPSGRRFLWIRGADQRAATAPGADVALNLEGYISITPMRCDLTAHNRLAELEARFA